MALQTPHPPSAATHHGRPCWPTRWRGGVDPRSVNGRDTPRDSARQPSGKPWPKMQAGWLTSNLIQKPLIVGLCLRHAWLPICASSTSRTRDLRQRRAITSHVFRVKAEMQPWIELPLKVSDIFAWQTISHSMGK
jgi:hypothetical protein